MIIPKNEDSMFLFGGVAKHTHARRKTRPAGLHELKCYVAMCQSGGI